MQQYVTDDQIMTLKNRYTKRLLERTGQRPCHELPVILSSTAGKGDLNLGGSSKVIYCQAGAEKIP